MTTCRDCGATWSGKRLEHCTVCHLTFTGTGAGDKHRTGAYFPNERRCLTPDEMRAKGMRQNDRGHWNLGGTSPWADDSGHTTLRATLLVAVLGAALIGAMCVTWAGVWHG